MVGGVVIRMAFAEVCANDGFTENSKRRYADKVQIFFNGFEFQLV